MKQIMRRFKSVILVSTAAIVAIFTIATVTLCCVSSKYLDTSDELNS